MSDYYSFEQLLKELDIKQFEIGTYFKKGLIPFDEYGKQIKCPKYCHKYFYYWNKRINCLLSKHTITNRILPIFEYIVKRDPEAETWEFFRIPDSDEEQAAVFKMLRESFFQKNQVHSMQKSLIKYDSEKQRGVSQSAGDSEKLILIEGYLKIKKYDKDNKKWETFEFNGNQAKIVEALHNADNYELHHKYIIKEILGIKYLSEYRLRNYFQTHKTWRGLIKPVSGKKGYWRLDIRINSN